MLTKTRKNLASVQNGMFRHDHKHTVIYCHNQCQEINKLYFSYNGSQDIEVNSYFFKLPHLAELIDPRICCRLPNKQASWKSCSEVMGEGVWLKHCTKLNKMCTAQVNTDWFIPINQLYKLLQWHPLEKLRLESLEEDTANRN